MLPRIREGEFRFDQAFFTLVWEDQILFFWLQGGGCHKYAWVANLRPLAGLLEACMAYLAPPTSPRAADRPASARQGGSADKRGSKTEALLKCPQKA